MFYKAVAGLNEFGLCPAADLPYLKKSAKRKPSAAAIEHARQWRERWQVHWLKRWSYDAIGEAGLVEFKRTIAAGHPVACGLRWPKQLKGSDLLSVPAAGQVFDGHSIALVGYADDPAKPGGGAFQFRNSAGSTWGNKGYGTMSYAYVRTYANDALSLRLEAPGSETPTVRYEAESLPVVASGRCQASVQKMNDWGAKMWSRGTQLTCAAEKEGFVELQFRVAKTGRYRARLLGTAAPDYGKIRVALDGQVLPPQFDLYSGQVSPAGSLELGVHELTAGDHRLRVQAVGKNPAAKNFYFGLDALDLIAAQ